MAVRAAYARQLGRDVSVEVGAREPSHLDPLVVAKHLEVEVAFGHLTGATARIHRIGKRARIRVSDQIVTPGRRRFSIMHELAHYLLGHEVPREGDADAFLKTRCAHRDKDHEREADLLAVEFLTPTAMVRPYCSVAPVNLHAVHALAEAFNTSSVMGAVRFAELSPERCAAVYSERGLVKWAKRSRTFPGYIASGRKLGADSVAARYFEHGALNNEQHTLPVATWVGGIELAIDAPAVVEHAQLIPEPGWGGVLSVLWIPRAESLAA